MAYAGCKRRSDALQRIDGYQFEECRYAPERVHVLNGRQSRAKARAACHRQHALRCDAVYPNVLYALDLSQPGAPLKWSYAPHPLAASQGVACRDVVNRGPTFANGRVFFNTLDGNIIAVDANSGK